ncbi:DUF5131 family protein [Saccharopolyspora sp. NPDC000359]|uniref:DUF5131 family protein n=1 Tax=Saccharopolyspora sp. NPDC000359 TaxID=3154251 RepID=UPI0033181651
MTEWTTWEPFAMPQPRRWRTPRHVVVVPDLFDVASGVADVAEVWAVMATLPQHTFQVTTWEGHDRMRSLLTSPGFGDLVRSRAAREGGTADLPWPLPNVWVGVGVRDQEQATLRVPDLLAIPAAVRFVWAQPLVGPLDLGQAAQALDWLLLGGDIGPASRPLQPAWARALRDQCTAAGVAFHFIGWGSWAPVRPPERLVGQVGHRQIMRQVGFAHAGRVLDDHTWEEMPTAGKGARGARRDSDRTTQGLLFGEEGGGR